MRGLAVVLSCAACGRINFDPFAGDAHLPGDVPVDVPTPLDPLVHADSAFVQTTCDTREFSAQGIAVDGAGNVYLGGCFSNTATFGSMMVTATSTEAGYMLGLDADLEYRGVRVFGTNVGSTHDVTNVVVANGSVYTSGTFESSIDLGGGMLSTAGGDDYFVARYALDGVFTHQFSSRYGGTGDEGYGEGLAVRADGFEVIAGGCAGTFSFGSTTLPGTSIDPCLGVVRDGVEQASWRWQSPNIGGVYSVALDGMGFAIAGHYEGMPPPFTGLDTGGMPDGFVASIAPDGSVVWAQDILGAGEDISRDVVVGDAGELYACGYAGAAIAIGGVMQPYAGDYDAWVARFDPGGTLAWATMIGGPGDDGAYEVFVAGEVLLVAGSFENTITVGGTDTLVSAGNFDIFVVALARSDGSVRWARRFGDVGDDHMSAATYGNGRLYITGSTDAPVDFGGGPVGASGTGVFVLALAPP